MVIIVGNGLGDTSSNPGRDDCIAHSTNDIYSTPLLRQDMTQGPFLSGV